MNEELLPKIIKSKTVKGINGMTLESTYIEVQGKDLKECKKYLDEVKE